MKRRKRKSLLKSKKTLTLDRITKEEISLSLIRLSVLLAAGIILSGTPFISPVLIIVLIGLVGSLIVLNHDK
ncbi:hypothetical protein HY501_00800 [Candidatus Woesearchaeota archaeon]|nr:hypothetical protein [Candidatus Woesearchaeota archaeon]